MKDVGAQEIKALLTPSWFSGLVAIIATLLIMGGAAAAAHFKGSVVQQALYAVHNSSSTPLQQVTDNLSRNTLLSNAPLFLFWAVVGIIIYYFAVNAYGAFTVAAEFQQELEHVHARRAALIREAVISVVLRAIVLAVWLLYLRLFLRILLPFSIDQVNVASGHLLTPLGGATLLGVFIVLLIALHLHVILLRLALLRARIFSSYSYK